MKRSWNSSQAQQLFTKLQQQQQKQQQQAAAVAASNTNSNTNSTDSSWLNMANHPYASAYSNLPSSSLLMGQGPQSNPGGGSQTDSKRPRSNKDDDDDDDEDDSDESDDDAAAKLAAQAAKPNRKIVKGPDGKPKVKLTRGSRACIA